MPRNRSYLIEIGLAKEDFGGFLPSVDVRLFDRMERGIGEELMGRNRLEGATPKTRYQSIGRTTSNTTSRRLRTTGG